MRINDLCFQFFSEHDESTATVEEVPVAIKEWQITSNQIGKNKSAYADSKRYLIQPFNGDQFMLPSIDDVAPFNYFKIFWDDKIKNLCQQANLYSVWKSGKCFNRVFQEMKHFIVVQMSLSLLSVPSCDIYIDLTNLEPVLFTNTMGLKWYENIKIGWSCSW